MANCAACGGVVGRDCFNPTECMWITQEMARVGQQHIEQQSESQIVEMRRDLRQLVSFIDSILHGNEPYIGEGSAIFSILTKWRN